MFCMKVETKIIIPAAGFGTRVGSPEAKELIGHQGKPLILKAIEIGQKLGIPCHVITREEKRSLIEFLSQYSHVSTQVIKPSKEWPDTILQSKAFWADRNILILPDTTWSPENIEVKILDALNNYDIAIGAFQTDNFKTWGVFNSKSNTYSLVEKPQINNPHYLAWGLLAFRKEVGESLFEKILESTFDHQEKNTAFTFQFFKLDQFTDLTR